MYFPGKSSTTSSIISSKKLKVKYDKSKPDGMPKKCLDISLAKGYGWRPIGDINKAFEQTYKDFLKNEFKK